MSRVLSGLEPAKVFHIFEDICAIPHGSGNTKAISDYCVNFAKSRGLLVFRDKLNNVIIKKPASAGYENHGAVVLQGHLDMVCEKDADIDFDFLREGLRLKTDGEFVFADGTTLGGDDGIAVAMALAVLDDDSLRHPPLEAVFTTDEETGMYGAAGLDTTQLAAEKFINIDSENEGTFTVGCAGGCRVDIRLPLTISNVDVPAYSVKISGLIGGHSGTEINKGRLNANKILGDFLAGIGGEVFISSISGGSKDNAIPVNAGCVICTNKDVISAAEKFVSANRLPSDKDLKITVNRINDCACAFSALSSKQIIDMLRELPNGVQAMSADIKGLVETSLNIGVMKTENDAFSVTLSVRSSKSRQKDQLVKRLERTAKKFGADFSVRGDYPAWEYRRNSPLRDKMVNVFKEMYGKEPKIEIIHAGLECGLFSEKIKNIDAVSIGPDLYDIHTPRERLSVSSAKRTYNYICRVLEAL